jgi:methionyl-tRNA formyltransferase
MRCARCVSVRTVYLGTSEFAAAVLERLPAPELVVTRPDRPAGRGRKLTPPPVALRARELGLEVFQPPSVNDDEARSRIAAARPDVVVVCAFGALLKEPLLSEHLMLNVHPSLLPRWRGAAPVERAIMAGDAVTGVSIMRPTEGFDEGPVCAVGDEAIAADDDYGTLSARLVPLSADLLIRSLDERPGFVEQAPEGVTYAEKIGPEDRNLDPATQSADELDRVVRALHPHIGARLGDLRVLRARPSDETDIPPGELAARDGRLLLGAAPGTLELLEVQPPGKRPMEAAAYARGHKIAP